MVEIGGRPILWHILKTYSHHGINEFIICCGYKGYLIKEYFANYSLYMSDVTFDMNDNSITVHQNNVEPWKVTLVDTGESTMTGGRLKRVKHYLDDQSFCFTYGDGLSDLDITKLISFHNSHDRLATVTAVKPPGRYGAMSIDKFGNVSHFQEKPEGDGSWINGGFFVLDPEVLNLIDGDFTIWEESPLNILAQENNLMAFKHDGFWRPMDTLRDKNQLESMWATGNAPWKKWT